MNRELVRVLYLHELKLLLRDRRTVFLSVVLPLVLFPATLYGTKRARERRTQTLAATEFQYAVTGGWADELRATLAAAPTPAPRATPPAAGHFRFKEVAHDDPEAALRARTIHFYIEALDGEEADALARKEAEEKGVGGPAGRKRERGSRPRPPGAPLVRLHYQGDRDNSNAGHRAMRDRLDEVRRSLADARLASRGFSLAAREVLPVEEENVASSAQVTGRSLGRLLTVFILMLMLTGGVSASVDSIAGEKERGTLETLLTTAAGRAEIVAGKLLLILTVMIVITVIQLGNMAAYLWLRVIPLPADFVIEAPPPALLALALLLLPLAAFAAALLLTISGNAKSYKEAQLYFLPVYLVSLLPAAAAALPGLPLRSAIVVVPIANVSVAVRDVLMGERDWAMILAVSAVMCVAAALMMRRSVGLLSAERLIVGGSAEAAVHTGGASLFPFRVARWYMLMWVVIFTVAANVPALHTLRRQLAFNMAVMLLGPLLMIAVYRLPVREALALRPVHPLTYVVVLLAVPVAQILAGGVLRLANHVIPVSPEMMEAFSKMILPDDVPVWQLFVMLAVVPGIVEEVCFRGVLLYGLSRRLRPLALVLVVAGVFGLFHISLFRLVPTAALGVLLTGIVLLTGSVLPAMLAHVANNALAIYAGMEDAPLTMIDDPWLMCAAAVVLALCVYVLYRTRRPYPGLRPWRAR